MYILWILKYYHVISIFTFYYFFKNINNISKFLYFTIDL